MYTGVLKNIRECINNTYIQVPAHPIGGNAEIVNAWSECQTLTGMCFNSDNL